MGILFTEWYIAGVLSNEAMNDLPQFRRKSAKCAQGGHIDFGAFRCSDDVDVPMSRKFLE